MSVKPVAMVTRYVLPFCRSLVGSSKSLAVNPTYIATVEGTVEDASGRQMGSDYVWSFKTGS